MLHIDVAADIGVDKSAYSKIEKGTRSLTIEELQKMVQLFNLTTDQIINSDGKIPKKVVIEDKTAVEQMRLIQQLDEDDKQTIFKLIDKMLTNKSSRTSLIKISQHCKSKSPAYAGLLLLQCYSQILLFFYYRITI
nr:helix-turn-helix transcriptional regulator [Terrimonas ginsenosidimutans]